MKRFINVILFVLFAAPLFGSIVESGAHLNQYETERFIFIYPDESKVFADYLISIADPLYEEVNGLLRRQSDDKITVTISADYESANGNSTPYPYGLINLYDVAPEIDSSIGNYETWYKMLFHHELTHSVSLTVRGPFWEVLSKIFGGWVVPQMYMEPMFMVEGVTVSFESLGGYGRANFPLIENQLQQDYIEGNFKLISQTTGPYDTYPYGNIYYHYGGFFSRYLQEKYGMDDYRDLWQEAGKGNLFLLYSGSFRRVYGERPRRIWDEFRESMAPRFVIDPAPAPLDRDYQYLSDLAAAEDKVYYFDQFYDYVKCYDTATGTESVVLRETTGFNTLDVSPDGTKLLVCYTGYNAYQAPKIFARVYDLERRRYEGAPIEGIREASFFDGGIVGIRPEAGNTKIVLIRDGVETVLLNGSKDIVYGTPRRLSGSEVVFLMNDKGAFSVAVIRLDTLQVSRFEFDADRVVENIGDMLAPSNRIIQTRRTNYQLNHTMGLSVSGGRIYFGYNNGNGFYKLAVIDGGAVRVQTNNVSGGVYDPVQAGGGIYCAGYFSDGHRFEKLTENPASLPGVTLAARRVAFTPDTNAQSDSDGVIPGEERFRPGRYLLPRSWYPSMAGGTDGFYNPGMSFVIMDPIRANIVYPSFNVDLSNPFLNWSLIWYNSALPVLIDTWVGDSLYAATTDTMIRQTYGGVGLGYFIGLFPANRYLYFNVSADLFFITPEMSFGENPYRTAYGTDIELAHLSVKYSTLASQVKFYKYRGFAFTLFGDYNVGEALGKGEFRLEAALPVWRGIFRLEGGYCDRPVFSLSGDDDVFVYQNHSNFREYRSFGYDSKYYLYASVNALAFNIEIQRGLGTFPLYFNRVFALAGYRAALFGDLTYHSVYARLYAFMALFYNLGFSTYIEGNYSINTGTFGWTWNFTTDIPSLGMRDRHEQEKDELMIEL